MRFSPAGSVVSAVATILSVAALSAQVCPDEPPFLNYQGGGSVTCPCFVVGEEFGAVFTAPAAHYPIEILRVGIGWGSFSGGAPQTLEQAVKIRAGGLPAPGALLAEMPGPVMTDGFINEFDFEPLPGEIIVASGPFTVTLEIGTANAGMVFSPSAVHDGNGCIGGRNVVFAIPGGWSDACSLGVTGDWVVHVVYRQTNCGVSDPEFIRGECNGDALVNIADAISLLAYLFPSGPPPVLPCVDACDANDDAALNIADAVALLGALFGSPTIPLPPPTVCGLDPLPDVLDCASAAACP
jgi:hypothetical protein